MADHPPKTLEELWHELCEKADETLHHAIAYFTPQVQSLSDDLPTYQHQEYPKWVDGKLVEAPEEPQEATQDQQDEPQVAPETKSPDAPTPEAAKTSEEPQS